MATLTPANGISFSQKLILGLIAFCTAIELGLTAADWGLFDAPRLRRTVYEFGGFWPGLLRDWTPNYTGQPTLMFITYGFLHGGLTHLIVNMMTLWSLGKAVVRRVQTRGLIMLYVAALIGGAGGYYLLASSPQPMVGASGGLFGLAGGLLAWTYVDRFTFKQGLWPVAQAVVLLIALNILLWWAMDGQLAWETHLGGFVTGWIAALMIDPRPKEITLS